MEYSNTKNCLQCKSPFSRQTTGSRKNAPKVWAKRLYCSIPCAAKANYRTGEASSNWRGGKTKCMDCSKHLAQRYSFRETLRCLSCAKTKEKHWNWKGGITPLRTAIWKSEQYQDWRNAVFARDNYMCQHCGDNQGGNLEADHILPFAYFPEKRFDIENGRTLCKDCHKKTDTYGTKATTFYLNYAIQ